MSSHTTGRASTSHTISLKARRSRAPTLEIWSSYWPTYQSNAPQFSVGPTSPMKHDATMEPSSPLVSPVMTSLFWWSSQSTQRWCHWPKMAEAQNNILVVAGYCQEEILSACFMCVNLPLHTWRCAESVVSLLPHSGFLAKNQMPDQALQQMRIPA